MSYDKYWGFKSNLDVPEKFENFLNSVLVSWVNMDVKEVKAYTPTIIKSIILDIEERTHIFTNELIDVLDTEAKQQQFLEDLYSKFKNEEDIYGAKYKILKKDDFGYHIAQDLITPEKSGSLKPIRPNYDMSNLPFSKVLFAYDEKVDFYRSGIALVRE